MYTQSKFYSLIYTNHFDFLTCIFFLNVKQLLLANLSSINTYLWLGSDLLEDVLSLIPGGEGDGFILGNVSEKNKSEHAVLT